MKILHVIDCISRTHGGGSARVPWYLAKYQARLGHDVTIFSSNDHASQEDCPPDVTLDLFQNAWNFKGWRITPTMMFRDFTKFDIIHCHNYRTIPNFIVAAASMAGVPYVLQASGSCLPIPEPRHLKVWKTYNDSVWQDKVLARASRLIACNDDEIDQYVAEGAPRDKCIRMDLGIDLEEWENLPPKRAGYSNLKTILYLAKYHEIKGPDMAIQAFELIPNDNVFLEMHGWDDGALGGTYSYAMRNGHNNGIVVSSFIDGQDKLQAFVDASVYIMPSRYEAFGLGLLEACITGTPVVMTDRCKIAPEVPPYCAEVVPFEAQAIADAITRILDNGDYHANKAARIAWAKTYSWERIAKETIELYQEVTGVN